MAILKGFPPSNTISPGTYIPTIKEVRVKIGLIPAENAFRTDDGCEFMMLGRDVHGCRAVCYLAKERDVMGLVGLHETPGTIYGFDINREVIWLKKVYTHRPNADIPEDCCQKCGEKLQIDAFSKEFGDWCPNPNCH